MAVANALVQRGSNCVTSAPWKSPMMLGAPFFGGYFGLADNWPQRRFASHKAPELTLRTLKICAGWRAIHIEC
jgi:hypothetical protein